MNNAPQILHSKMRTTFFERRELFDKARPFFIEPSDMSFRAGGVAGPVKMSQGGLFVVDGAGNPVLSALSANTTVGGEALAAGDVMLGDNDTSPTPIGNVLYDQSAGDLIIRRGTTPRIRMSSDGNLRLYAPDGTTTRMLMSSAGVLSINNSSGSAVFTFDAAAGAEFTLPLTIASGGGIYQGSSGSFSSPTTGFKLYQSGSNGVVEFWNSGNKEIWIDPTSGVSIRGDTTFNPTRAFNMRDSAGTTRLGEVFGYTATDQRNTSLRAWSDIGSTVPRAQLLAINAAASSGISQASMYAIAKFTAEPLTFSEPYTYLVVSARNDSAATTQNSFLLDQNVSSTRRCYISGSHNWSGDISIIDLNATNTNSSARLVLTSSGTSQTAAFTVDDVTSSGSKSFRIDHPLHPLTKWLSHAAVESDGMTLTYHGQAIMDTNGEATIKMPDWFVPITKDWCYQLTCVGDHAPVYVTEVLPAGKFDSFVFSIRGGKPGLRVDWMINATRDDVFARRRPYRVEQDKAGDDVGRLVEWQGRNQRREFAPLSRPPQPETEKLVVSSG